MKRLILLLAALLIPFLALAEDDFRGARGMTYAATKAADITPHDTNVQTNVCRAIYIGGAGNLKVTMLDGGVVTFTGLTVGSLLPVRPSLIWSTGTTATLMLCLW